MRSIAIRLQPCSGGHPPGTQKGSCHMPKTEMDRIEISGLRVMTLVGVLAHEREAPQPLEFDIVLEVDLRDAGTSDDLADTAHYGLVAERAAAIARETKDELLERLVHRIAEDALTIDRVEAVEVVVRKLRPPIPEEV